MIAASPLPHIRRGLNVAWLALIGYAVFGGLIVPPGEFFPANWLNAAADQAVDRRPRAHFSQHLRAGVDHCDHPHAGGVPVELDRRLDSMEETAVLAADRERIGRELHDGTLQTIYASGLLLQAAAKELPPDAVRRRPAWRRA